MSKKKEATLNEVSDLVRHVVKHMATKEDLAREIGSVRAEMATKEDLTRGIGSVRKDIAGIRDDIIEIQLPQLRNVSVSKRTS